VVTLSRALADEMIAHARSELPNESCGIFGGTLDGELRTFFPAKNADASPYRYSVDADDLLRIALAIDGADDDVAAIYHSHTMSRATPSRTDMELATWPEAAYIIVSLASDAPRRAQAARAAPARDHVASRRRRIRRAARPAWPRLPLVAGGLGRLPPDSLCRTAGMTTVAPRCRRARTLAQGIRPVSTRSGA
jgi:[CysO sulfur-carrier protein]-S-L-cysteine hydrolase